MTKLYVYSLIYLCVFFSSVSVCGQEENNESTLKNLVSTNLMLPIFESYDISFERTITSKVAIGLAGAIYGNKGQELSISDPNHNYRTNFEIMPFARIYFGGAQNSSPFVELFTSWSEGEEFGKIIRSTNIEGYGVYGRGATTENAAGVGIGAGHRFLLLEKRLLLEAQFGLRTNFDETFNVLNEALVRTGIKVGFRF